MNLVQPIRDLEKIEEIKQYFKETSERNYIMFMIGINVGLRISDILSLKVSHVKGTHITLHEKKTRKRTQIRINETLRKELDNYIKDKEEDDYLFIARSKKLSSGLKEKPLDRSSAYKILSSAARNFGLKDIGCHTLRKTFGYHFYRKTKDIALLMDLFNHSEESITLRYIGIKQETLDDALDRFEL